MSELDKETLARIEEVAKEEVSALTYHFRSAATYASVMGAADLAAARAAARAVQSERARHAAEVERLRKLARFGLACFDELRNDGDPGDIDGGWAQDKAQELGLLVEVRVYEPCVDPSDECSNCYCAEYGDFPQECLRESPTMKETRASLAGGEK